MAGTRYYIGTAGAITSVAPTVNSKAVLIADSTTSGYVQQSGNPNLVAQTGSVSVSAQTFSTNSFVDSTNGIYTIPSAGTWFLRYNLATDGTGLNDNSQFAITDALNNIIAGSEKTR